MSDVDNPPPSITPDEGGVESNRQSDQGTLPSDITQTTIPKSPFGEHLSALSESGSTAFGGRIGTQLTSAAFQQLEHTNHRQSVALGEKDKQIQVLNSDKSDLRVELAKRETASHAQQKTSWVMAGIFALSTLLFSIGYTDSETRIGAAVMILGGACFLLGFFYPLLNRPGVKND